MKQDRPSWDRGYRHGFEGTHFSAGSFCPVSYEAGHIEGTVARERYEAKRPPDVAEHPIDPTAIDAQKKFIDRAVADVQTDFLVKAVDEGAKAMVKASKRKPAKRAKKR